MNTVNRVLIPVLYVTVQYSITVFCMSTFILGFDKLGHFNSQCISPKYDNAKYC